MVDLQKGLVGHWTMDDRDTSSGMLYDRSAYNHNGTLINSPSTGVNGIIRQGYSFNDNNLVNVGKAMPNSLPMSVGGWISINSSNTREADIIGNYNGSNGVIFRTRPTNGNPIELWFSGSGHTSNTGLVPERGTYVHLFGVADSNNVYYYKNGNLVDTVSNSSSLPNVNNDSRMASRGDSNSRYDLYGRLDDVRLYNRALTSEEVNALYQMRSLQTKRSRLQKGLVGYWTMDNKDTSNSTLYDSSAYNDNGSIGSNITTGISAPVGQGYSFNGGQVSSISSKTIGTSSFSFSFWIKGNFNNSSQTYPNIFNNFWGRNPNDSGFRFDSNSTSRYIQAFRYPNSFSNWTHIACRVDQSSGNAYFYQNGSQIYTESFSAGETINSSVSFFGSSDLVMDVSEFRYYKRLITVEEVNQLYQMRTQ